MIKDTVSMVLTAKELSTYVEKKIDFLRKSWEKDRIELETGTSIYEGSYSIFINLDNDYLKWISQEETFLKLLQKFPKNKHELFLDDIEYYGILEINTEAPPNVGC